MDETDIKHNSSRKVGASSGNEIETCDNASKASSACSKKNPENFIKLKISIFLKTCKKTYQFSKTNNHYH